MAAQTLPAAIGFLASVREDSGAGLPRRAFAARGEAAEVRDGFPGSHLVAHLLHSGAPDGAHAHAGGRAVLLAGELYNRGELLSLLPDGAASADDAALVLALFARYDRHAFRLLNGRFAALLVEGGRVVLATDHAGTVPLYANVAPGRLLAATEVKTLRTAVPGRPLAGTRPVRGLPGTYQLRAGLVLDVDLGSGACTADHTWAPPRSRLVLPEDEAVGLVRRSLEGAVHARLGTATPMVVLSGGIDSSGVAALAAGRLDDRIDTVSMGTEDADEFAQARTVAEHIGSHHSEITIPTDELLRSLPHAVWAAETLDPAIVEYLLPLTALYLRIGGGNRRILTGYGADIPLGGMHREGRLAPLDDAIVSDMDGFDGLNELTPVLSTVAGHWTTHPYWDRAVLDVLVSLEAGLKSRYGRDKWVLREALADLLPRQTVLRPKLGVHEGSGVSSAFSEHLVDAGLPHEHLRETKKLYVRELFDLVVVGGRDPDEVETTTVLERVTERLCSKVVR
ncbi:asparagine synthase [Streptomyces sulfonofaciens]|uniref:Asparagine synthase n=1 Tax=Streptomyces sulfonofaciens TaxID=68272 RepID=A0A919GMX8_9ACTN|nr:asparagine synthase-related protein [Streptomyces sulfonofaciens]GHH87119.1 asparagine synthase [Streptomyces sulfonofaciens]